MWFIVAVMSVFLIISGCALFSTYQSARVYNKICQPTVPVTMWDAMWVELRVDVCRLGENIRR